MGAKLKATAVIFTVLLSDLLVAVAGAAFIWVVVIQVVHQRRIGELLMLLPAIAYPAFAIVQLTKFPRLVREGRAAEIRRAEALHGAESLLRKARPQLPQPPQAMHADGRDGT